MVPPANTKNNAGGPAYLKSAEQALAQYACTGFMGSTYYASQEQILEDAIKLADSVSDEFLAKCAVYAYKNAKMRDFPAFLGVKLSNRNPKLWRSVFKHIAVDARMVKNVCQIVRSGRAGRKSLGRTTRSLIQDWFSNQTPESLYRQSFGKGMSLGDVVRLAHVKPKEEQAGIFRYLVGGNDEAGMPDVYHSVVAWRNDKSLPLPNVAIEFVEDAMDSKAWAEFAARASYRATIKNLSNFHKYGVLTDPKIRGAVCDRIRNEWHQRGSGMFPYAILQAFFAAESSLTNYPDVLQSLHDALDLSLSVIHDIPGDVYVLPDVSGSMNTEIGTRHGSSGAKRVRYVEISALVSAAMLANNPNTVVLPFSEEVRKHNLRPQDSVLTNVERLASLRGGGTDCAAPLRFINEKKFNVDVIIFVSDNESWVSPGPYGGGTAVMNEWRIIKSRCPGAKMICIDISPTKTAQVASESDILSVGGWSDDVFRVMATFVNSKSPDHWVDVINSTEL